MSKFKKADLNKVKTVSLGRRKSKADIGKFAKLPSLKGAEEFLDSLPHFLKASELNDFIDLTAKARSKNHQFHLMMGAHVIKVGLSPIIIDLMRRKIATGISLNSAGLIHDLEIAFTGKTSEDVKAGLADGSFGMAKETGDLFAKSVDFSDKNNCGLGEAAGFFIDRKNAPFKKYSLFYNAYKYNLPATVHLMLGADIVQQQPSFNPEAASRASYDDFKILAELMKSIDSGGVVANIGSSVVLPEVFLKALTIARNLNSQKKGRSIKSRLITANFDMIQHYRPNTNVVSRPTADGSGKGFCFTGHHEIMIPLLYWGLKTRIKSQNIRKE